MAHAGSDIRLRPATAADAPAIAALHADSWRRNYRGAYSDAFLDGDLDTDRLKVWGERLQDRTAATATFAAEAPGCTLAGFAHVAFGAHPLWGALLDNLHVARDLKRSGIGTRLMSEVAVASLVHDDKLHLYVLEQNTSAQAFYQARGGRFVEASFVSAPGGVASRLNGTPKRHLYVWDDPALLLHP